MAQGSQVADGPELISAKDCRAWSTRRGTLRGQRDRGEGSLDGYNIILDGAGKEETLSEAGDREEGKSQTGEEKMSRRRDHEV